jgi:uncharacterized membrane protein YjjP (DUF1212 family)
VLHDEATARWSEKEKADMLGKISRLVMQVATMNSELAQVHTALGQVHEQLESYVPIMSRVFDVLNAGYCDTCPHRQLLAVAQNT